MKCSFYSKNYTVLTKDANYSSLSIVDNVESHAHAKVDAEQNIKFDPPVYKQRYIEVQQILLANKFRKSFKKIVDFGCSEFGLFYHLKRLFRIQHILMVDVDEISLSSNLFKLRPLTIDYINKRTEPLNVHVFAGSITNPDIRLIGVDVVIAIEVIEHLYPDTLDALPYNIFGFIKPKLAIFTTPNADFNVIFPDFQGFRHYDHKFEWTRKQFQSWSTNIVTRYPNYSVTFIDIGKGPIGTEHLGCCSQMAVFEKINECENMHIEGCSNISDTECKLINSFGVCTYFSCTNLAYEMLDLPLSSFYNEYHVQLKTESDYYKSIETIEYPFEVDLRTPEQKILDDLKYRINLLGYTGSRFYNSDLNRCEIPVVELIYYPLSDYTSTTEASEILARNNYKVEECTVGSELEACVIYEPVMEDRSATSLSYNSTSRGGQNNSDKEISDWSTVSSVEEFLDWDDGEQSNQEFLSERSFEERPPVEDINNILGNLVRNIQSREDTTDASIRGIDSGYNKSNTYSSDSFESGPIISELAKDIDAANSEDFETNSTDKLFLDSNVLFDVTNITDKKIISDHKKLILPVYSSVLGVNSCEQNTCDSTEKFCNFKWNNGALGSSGLPKTHLLPNNADKTCNVKDHLCESLPGTSNMKNKKKKLKKPENMRVGEHKIVFDVVQPAQDLPILEHVVENGDLANNNRDIEGNNYPNAGFLEGEDNEPIDNESVENNMLKEEDQIDEDLKNRNEYTEEEELKENEQIVNESEVEIEFASREALFDPNSEVDLLAEYNVASAASASIAESPEDLLVIGMNNLSTNSSGTAAEAILPMNADPFPNWLLHLLGADIVEDVESHNEPHFYCQGDGLGVHPSFMEEDYEDDQTSSGSDTSTSNQSSNDDAEADPTVSEGEVVSLPDDNTNDASNPLQEISVINARENQSTLGEINNGASSSTDSVDEYFDSVQDDRSMHSTGP